MTLALLGAFGAAVAYGVASVLQAVGARRADADGTATVDTGIDGTESRSADRALVVRLALEGPFVAGLACDGLGAALSFAALRTLPLFLVQSCVASALAVTAVVASRVFARRLAPVEWAGVAAVVVGLALLGGAATGREATPATTTALRLGLLAGALILAGLGWLGSTRLAGARGAAVLGLLSGLGFGTASMSVPVITSLAPAELVRDPATGAVIVGAAVGVLSFAVALQRGSVTNATAAMVVGETLLPSVFGLVVLHERPRTGWVPMAVLGFLAAVAGAVLLSRFGEIESLPVESEVPKVPA